MGLHDWPTSTARHLDQMPYRKFLFLCPLDPSSARRASRVVRPVDDIYPHAYLHLGELLGRAPAPVPPLFTASTRTKNSSCFLLASCLSSILTGPSPWSCRECISRVAPSDPQSGRHSHPLPA
ncbi:hypothetical protein K458DRAFT_73761 [Lentithecium fluviatile CBS 122367]|uniref:Uncharacterized protein n=1 Tax=Lentithecium fluviatile CBS 122367 TaxID=1168545 RepID=A0A6G1IVW0_9PLEO|nr:hypothetical protein K458DRAFT_73761 [Lentithecium fluviatile CBS 122367]